MKRLSETALIDWIRRRSPADPRVWTGIGDDAAVVKGFGSEALVLKTDMILENVHFDRKTSTPFDWGYKAAAVNLSDFAAMGAEPHYALAAMGLPKTSSAAEAREIIRGMERALAPYRVRLVGGDTCRSEGVTVAVFMVGAAKRGRISLRSGARAGDFLYVSGPLGGSLGSGHHMRFKPRIAESRFLTANYRVRAMMDISDGLAKDLRLMGQASGVGFELREKSVPIRPNVRKRGIRAAFLDGEDFELVFALAPLDAKRLERDPRVRRNGFNFYKIGQAVHKRQGFTFITADDKRKPFPPFTDHHFGS